MLNQEKSAGSGESSPNQAFSSRVMNKMSAGSGELFLSGENERGAVFTHRGRQRVRLSGSLTQGVIGGVCGMEWMSKLVWPYF